MPRFQKSDRIRTRTDWAAARKAAVRAHTRSVSVSVVHAKGKRLGVVVGAHVGNAVERNRLKRIFREYFRVNRGEFPLGDLVVTAKQNAAALDNKELREELRTALRKINKK